MIYYIIFGIILATILLAFFLELIHSSRERFKKNLKLIFIVVLKQQIFVLLKQQIFVDVSQQIFVVSKQQIPPPLSGLRKC